ncbi:hypothetical protein KY345_03805 [Candidatus Woesearchaeota archaeon]|nr:hypothetical protein [Candidatus Woesearchaeota archaeon]
MGMKNLLLISIIALSIMLAGCGPYQYETGKEIPVSVEEGEEVEDEDVDDFKSEFEKLQALLEEEETEEEEEEEAEEEIIEVVEEPEEEEAEIIEVVDEEEEEEVVEEVAEEEEIPAGAPTITVTEGDLVNLAIKSDDPDDDTITYTFTEPLDDDGRWQTEEGDAGTYDVTITASDGELSTSQDVYIVVEELILAPTISNFDDVTVDEGDTVTLSPKVTDPQGGSVTLEYSGWMISSSKTTGYDDAGTYEVTLKATSSESGESTTETITVTVNNKNRPPKILSITNE